VLSSTLALFFFIVHASGHTRHAFLLLLSLYFAGSRLYDPVGRSLLSTIVCISPPLLCLVFLWPLFSSLTTNFYSRAFLQYSVVAQVKRTGKTNTETEQPKISRLDSARTCLGCLHSRSVPLTLLKYQRLASVLSLLPLSQRPTSTTSTVLINDKTRVQTGWGTSTRAKLACPEARYSLVYKKKKCSLLHMHLAALRLDTLIQQTLVLLHELSCSFSQFYPDLL
jgi:hypothetical protein